MFTSATATANRQAPALMKGVKTLLPQFVAKSSSGIKVQTECGKTFTDMTSGIGVTNLGKTVWTNARRETNSERKLRHLLFDTSTYSSSFSLFRQF